MEFFVVVIAFIAVAWLVVIVGIVAGLGRGGRNRSGRRTSSATDPGSTGTYVAADGGAGGTDRRDGDGWFDGGGHHGHDSGGDGGGDGGGGSWGSDGGGDGGGGDSGGGGGDGGGGGGGD
ncbi:hypothetical protein [Nocardioides sp.]|uniref:hypothetical protein n=1 Tax=Nocardioides sp. TaxID=35761 RepID=UPI0027177F41|nr:hypothetical protein [Nocardioides sp.]MDO9458434.1 hypothetical protein [Nocardioides sp.]